jgi:hypothetical protein
VPCQAGLLFADRRTAGLPAQLKKSRKVGPKQKNTFFAAAADRNDPA